MKLKNKEIAFWVTNISDRNVSLSDLALTINSFTTVNLLDSKHYQYTQEQLEKSATSGSLFKKRNKIVVRKVAPFITQNNDPNSKKFIPCTRDASIPDRARSVLILKEEQYEELNTSDEEFAKENADTADMDQKPIIVKG